MVIVRNAYKEWIKRLSSDLLDMGALVSERLRKAMSSLERQDRNEALEVINGDSEIDRKDHDIEMGTLHLISLQQPTEADLRDLASMMRISRDLERIGDYATDIAEVADDMVGKGPYFKPLVDIPKMAGLAQAMLQKALKAYLDRDLDAAMQLDCDDDEVDTLYTALSEELLGYLKRGPQYIDQACGLLLVARHLERIADHAVNVAEMTVFALTGDRRPFAKDVGHPKR